MKNTVEQSIQRSCVTVLNRFVPPPPTGPAWTAINPVPAKSKAVAGVSKAMGLRAGWPDFELLWCGSVIYIEFKRPKSGRTDKNQDRAHDDIRAQGGAVHIVRSIEEFVDVLNFYNIPCRISAKALEVVW